MSTCDICGAVFDNFRQLNGHMNAHKKDPLEDMKKAVGPCDYCGRLPTWFNDIPLTAFCWGPENNEHEEWKKVVPAPHQPYEVS